ncbi:MAG: VWA domain-containing protein [Kofleriaceae bacterium]|nr:VWA domain-containing protein [Kofleriaceae bacterium]
MNKLGLAAILFLSACGVSADDGFLGDSDGGGGTDGGFGLPDSGQPPVQGVCSKMDILFVIDDSGSMGEEQGNLAQNFPLFIEALDNFNDGSLDYRVAVTTTGRDVDYLLDISIPLPGFPPLDPIPMSESGDNGVMRQECGMTSRWIDRSDTDVASTFSCVAAVGTGGPALEMPLYATQLALGARMTDGTNSGFLREDSLLGVIILTDEDDCSRTDNDFTIQGDQCGENNPDYLPVSDTINFLDALTGERGRWATAVIAGPSSCESSFGTASAALNLQNFVTQTGENAVFSSICSGNLVAPLEEALAKFDAACQGFPEID